jgi:pyruvate-formate lyase-activating enzyme
MKTRVIIQDDGRVVMTDAWANSAVRMEPCRGVNPDEPTLGLLTYGRLFGEEPPISGETGAGAFYVHGCAFRCHHCYQPEFFSEHPPLRVTVTELVQAMLAFEAEGCASILWVASHGAEHALEASRRARRNGLRIPIFLKTSGVMAMPLLRAWHGVANGYVPDLKAFSEQSARDQGLPPTYVNAALKTAEEWSRLGGRVIARYLWRSNDAHFESDWKSVLERAQAHGWELSLLTEFWDVAQERLRSMPTELRLQCEAHARQKGVPLWTQTTTASGLGAA